MSTRLLSALVVLLLLAAGSAVAQPATNPLDPKAGDYLDFPVDSVKRAAYNAYQGKRYEEAALFYLEALRYDVSNSSDIYNLACCYGLLGNDSLAARYLRRAFKAGLDDVDHVRKDPDFDSVRARPVFASLVESLATAAAKAADKRGRPVDILASSLLPCYVRLPDDYDSTKTYPLVIGLHGYGASPKGFTALYDRAGKPQFIFAALQAPYPFGAGNDIGYSWTVRNGYDSTTGPLASRMSAEYVSRAATRLSAMYRVGDIYLLGFSQGCGMAYFAGIRHASQFKGIIGFGGGLDTTRITPDELNAAKHLRVFIAHGRDDQTVEYARGVSAHAFLRGRGFDVTFVDFPGGHAVPEEPLKRAIQWMMGRSSK